jgi:hypothetical protein
MAGRLAHVLTPHFFADAHSIRGAVYGTLTVVAVIGGASHSEDSAARVLAFAAVSSVAIWAVHVYAHVLTSAGVHAMSFRAALQRGLRSEAGVLFGAIVPLLFLLVGTLERVDDEMAIWWSMWSGAAMLALNPLVWLRRAGEPWSRCVTAAMSGGLLGLVLIFLKIALH